MAEQKYCTNCGQELTDGARFCAGCGTPVGGVPVSGNTGNTGGENLTGIIPNVSRKKGLFKLETFNVLVTEKRLIFALVTKEIMKEQAAQLKGQGFMASMQGAISGEYITRRYQDMPPEQALQETPDNFAIEASSVKKVKISSGMANPETVHDSDGKLEIQTPGEKYKFSLSSGSIAAAKTVLKNAGLLK